LDAPDFYRTTRGEGGAVTAAFNCQSGGESLRGRFIESGKEMPAVRVPPGRIRAAQPHAESVPTRSFENQRYRASGLNLMTATIVQWNTVYLDRAIQAMKEQAIKDHDRPMDEDLLQHLSPLGWEHINLTGDYVWRQGRRLDKGKYRPLQPMTTS